MDAFPKASFPFFSIDACSYFFFNSLYLNTKHKKIIRKLVMTENLYPLMVKSGRWWELSEASGCGFDGDGSMAFLCWVWRRFRSDPLLFRVMMIMNSEEFLSLHSYLHRRIVILKVCFFFFLRLWSKVMMKERRLLWTSVVVEPLQRVLLFDPPFFEEPYETLILPFDGPGRFLRCRCELNASFSGDIGAEFDRNLCGFLKFFRFACFFSEKYYCLDCWTDLVDLKTC